MASITVRPLSEQHSFGARITGVNRETVRDEGVCREILNVFDTRGMIIFEEMEPSDEMQLALSRVIGPPQEHAIKGMIKADAKAMPGVVDIIAEAGDTNVYEIGGKPVAGWTNWHFDACYVGELNRGGVLRLTVITPEDGMTGFADGIQIHNALPGEWRAQAEAMSVVYDQSLMFDRQRFGMPEGCRLLYMQTQAAKLLSQAMGGRRAIHPAVWQRQSGEKVLHIAPWQAAGIEGRETAEGDALYGALWQEVLAKMNPYWHKWKATDMVLWDNWRFLHTVGGHDPKYSRSARRTTIAGDYGLGRLEHGPGMERPVAAMA